METTNTPGLHAARITQLMDLLFLAPEEEILFMQAEPGVEPSANPACAPFSSSWTSAGSACSGLNSCSRL